jgi:hypothetical protein
MYYMGKPNYIIEKKYVRQNEIYNIVTITIIKGVVQSSTLTLFKDISLSLMPYIKHIRIEDLRWNGMNKEQREK